jgi:hypothetical protein
VVGAILRKHGDPNTGGILLGWVDSPWLPLLPKPT